MRLLAALLLCLPLLGQDLRFPGRRAVFAESTSPVSNSPRLWLRNLTLPVDWARGEADLLALWGEDLEEGSPTPAQLETLWSAEGWDPASPRTVLVDGAGRKVASWPGMPRPSEVLEALRTTGWRPHLEGLEAFIRDHPDQTQARAARLTALLFRLLRLDDPRDAERAKATAAAVREALRDLRGDPTWVDHAPVLIWCSLLGQLAKGTAPPFTEEDLRPLREDVARALLQNTYDSTLWSAWSQLVSQPEEVQSVLDRLVPLPGEPPLPGVAQFSVILALARLGAGPALETLAERMLAARPPFPLLVQARWRAARVSALFLQDRKAEGFRQLQTDLEQRPEAGFWVQFLLGYPDVSNPLTEAERKRVTELLSAHPPRRGRPAPPEPVPLLRLDLAGSPAWAKGAAALPEDPAFDDWSEADLAWGTLDPATWEELRARQAWGPEGRWVLHRGSDLIASGTELPPAAVLADRLREAGPPPLAQLRVLLKQHPDLAAARRRRLRLLQARMPHPRLELLLREDALALQEAFLHPVDLAEKLQKPLWEGAARRILPELEAQIRRWPEDQEAWTAWLDWTRMAGKGDAAALLAGLDLVPLSPGEEGPLPYRLASDLADHLKAQGRTAELAAWGRPFWPQLRIQLPSALELAKGANREPPDNREAIARWEVARIAANRLQSLQALLRGWVGALRATGAAAEAEAVAQALEALQPGLSLRLLGSPERKPPTAPSRPAPPRP